MFISIGCETNWILECKELQHGIIDRLYILSWSDV